ncbi:MAG TPA: C4-dicarboxylate ABC transporter, partial [Bosea sp. (in: a-proteobacteria)]|nr:C4-dicarboxylate ABC transporter [Bosea sp. (in: a-proteobacteria)]
MKQGIDRRTLLAAGGALALTGGSALAQAKPNLRFSAVFSEQDIRAEMMKRFGEAIKDD